MAKNQQDILVKIRVLLEGLGNVRALAGHIKELSAGGGKGGQTLALAGDLDKLSAAVDRLAASQEKASSKGGFVRFLVGVSAVVNTLATVPQALTGIEKLLDFFDNIGGGVGKAVGKVKEFGTSLFSSLKDVATGVGAQAGGAIEGLSGAVGGLGAALGAALPFIAAAAAVLAVLLAAVAALAIAFTGLAAAVGLGLAALVKIGPAGVQLNSQLEQVKLGIAAVITSLADMKVAGIPVEGAEKFQTAMQLAADQVAKLRVDAIQTTATFEQIAPAFQAAIAPGLAAGLTLDQIRETTVKIVQAAGAIGLPLEQVNQEVRALLEGTINEDARLAKVLGISNKMVASWKQQGTLAEELNKRLAGFAVAGEEAANTLDGLQSNLQEALNVFSQEATTRAFAALKDEFARLLPQLFDFKSAGLAPQFQVLAQLADDVLVRVIRLGGEIAQVVVTYLKRAADFVAQNRAQIDNILNLVVLMVKQLGQGAGVFARIATDTATWRSLLTVVQMTLGLINLLVDALVFKLREVEPLLRLAALAGAALLVATNPGLAAAVSVPTRADDGGQGVVELNPDGSLKQQVELNVTPRAGGGGKGGGGGRHSQIRELTRAFEEAKIDAALAQVQARSELIRQSIEASIDALHRGLEDSMLSISEVFRLEALKVDEALHNQLTRIDAEIAAALARHKIALEGLDPKLTPKEKHLAVQTENTKLLTETNRLEAERKKLVEETADKKAGLVRDEAAANKAFADSLTDIENQFDSLSLSNTQRAEARAREIDAQFADQRQRLLAQINAAPTEANRELQRAAEETLNQLDDFIARLKAKGLFEETAKDIERILSTLRAEQGRLNNRVELGELSAADAIKERIELEKRAQRHLAEYLATLKAAAAATKDPATREALKQIVHEVENLGKVIDETARHLNETLKAGLIDTLTDIITRTKTVGEAFRALAQTILAEIARILATKFIENLFGGLFQTKTGLGGGSIGNVIASTLGGLGGLFGHAEGGPVKGPGTGTSDSILARLSNGEFVIREWAARMLGPGLLNFINNFGRLPALAAGGFVLEPPRAPSFGDFGGALASAVPASSGGDTYNVKVNAPIQTKDVQSFRQSDQAIKQSLSRAVQEGIRRAKSRPKS